MSEPPRPKESAPPSGESAPSSPRSQDVVLLGPPTADGAGVHVIRAREERIETGELRALQHGKPITGEVVTLQPRDNSPRVCDVTASYAPPQAHEGADTSRGRRGGPAKVATDAYRQGWDQIFGAKPKPPSTLN